MRTRLGWKLVVATAAFAGGCSDPLAPPRPAEITPADRAKFIDPALLTVMPNQSVLDEPRLRDLLQPAPGKEALDYLSDEVLYEPTETRFLSMMVALTTSKNAAVERLAADVLSGAYPLSLSAGIDVGPAIERCLASKSAAVRRMVVRNLGLADSTTIRAWIHAHETDEEADETDPAHPTIASEAKAALARLIAAANDGRSVLPIDHFDSFDSDAGRTGRSALTGLENFYDMVVTDLTVGSRTRAPDGPREPIVSARMAMQTPSGFEVAVLTKRDAPAYSVGFVAGHDTLLMAWSRPVSPTRVRFWMRCMADTGPK